MLLIFLFVVIIYLAYYSISKLSERNSSAIHYGLYALNVITAALFLFVDQEGLAYRFAYKSILVGVVYFSSVLYWSNLRWYTIIPVKRRDSVVDEPTPKEERNTTIKRTLLNTVAVTLFWAIMISLIVYVAHINNDEYNPGNFYTRNLLNGYSEFSDILIIAAMIFIPTFAISALGRSFVGRKMIKPELIRLVLLLLDLIVAMAIFKLICYCVDVALLNDMLAVYDRPSW